MIRVVLFLIILTTGNVTHSASSAHKLSLPDQPLGHESAEVLAEAASLWSSEPDCDTVRTGVGMTRRAYFLQSCKFTGNNRDITIYDERVSTATYHFLENALVQISYSINNIVNEDKFRRCAAQDASTLETQADSTKAQSLLVTEEQDNQVVVSISSAIVEQIHSLKR